VKAKEELEKGIEEITHTTRLITRAAAHHDDDDDPKGPQR